ncbi:MAG: MATE family efflux transporter [Bacteroidales bacterium]|nr:MATE family efflux transporter [Bacteroidales bacterium]
MNPLNKEILRLALPSILANLTVPIVGMVDIAVAGHLQGTELFTAAAFIGGISIGSMLFDLLYWNFAFLRVGTGGLTAQAYGRGDRRECARILMRALLLALGCAALILLIQWPFSKLAFLVIDSSGEVKQLALKYFFIRVWAAPATLGLMGFRGWFIGMQDSFSSMMTDLVVNGVNIAASIILTLGIGTWEGFGFPGIALGTVIAQYSGLLYATLKVLFRYRHIFDGFSRQDLRQSFAGSEIRGFMSMNGDIFIRSLGFMAIYISIPAIAAHYGDLMLAANTILMKLLMIFSFFTDGFAYAGEALTGRFIGAKDLVMTKKSVRSVFYWSMSIVLGFMAAYWFGGVPMLRLMSSDAAVVEASRQFLPWLVLMPLTGCAAFTWDGIYLGATASKGIRDAMLWAAAAFFACWFAGVGILRAVSPLPHDAPRYQALAIHVLMAAYFAHLLARTVVLTVRYRRDVLAPHFPSA